MSLRGHGGRVGPAVFSTAGGDAIGKLALLLTTLLAARALSPLYFGEYIALAATLVVAASLWDLGLTTLLTREVAAGQMGTSAGVEQALLLRLRTAPVWMVAFAIGSLLLTRGSAVSLTAILGFGAASIVFGVHSVLLAALRGSLRFGFAAGALAGGRCLTALGLALVIGVAGSGGLGTIALLTLLGEATTLVLACVGFSRESAQGDLGGSHLSIRAALPFAANSAFSMAYNRLDVILVPALAGVGQLALYAPASRLQDALYLLPYALGTVALPIAANRHRAGLAGEAGQVASRLVIAGLVVALPVAIAVFVFVRPILTAVLGSGYSGASASTRILVWFLPLAVVQAPLFAVLIADGRERTVTKVIAVTFGTALLLHLALDPIWGAVGGAIASLSRDLVAAPLTLALAVRAGVFEMRPAFLRPVGEV